MTRFGTYILKIVVLFSISVSGAVSQSDVSVYSWIFFRDKQPLLSSISLAEKLGITPRALWRRSKVLPPDRLIDERDFPVSQHYVRQIEMSGLKVRSVSRWLNAVSVEGTPTQLQATRSYPFVKGSAPVASMKHPPIGMSAVPQSLQMEKRMAATSLVYGPSLTQLSNINVVDVHDLGIYGSGIIVGMIDNGFNNHTVHPALKNLRVLYEYDFIHRITSTDRQPWEGFSQGNHGEVTLSTLAGFYEDSKFGLIGPAFGASLILAKTEMDSTEVHAEEDLYVEALEWMESLGADVVSSSLGYDDFLPPGYNPGDITYWMKDGKTGTTSIAAGIAASKGVLLVTSMGNEGHYRTFNPDSTGTLVTPADADSILSVGATYSDGIIADFSSTGPTADGRTKPEVVAQGVSVYVATGTDAFGYAQGTSLSTPLVAGVAALVLSAHPELTPIQVRDALMQTAFKINDIDVPSRSDSYPNNFYGSGMVDAWKAILYHNIAISNRPQVVISGSAVTAYISIASNTTLVADSLFFYYQPSSGSPFERALLVPTAIENQFSVTVPVGADTTYPRGYFYARDTGGRTNQVPYNAPDSLIALRQYLVSSVPGSPGIPTRFVLHTNFPNPFNNGTTITFDAPGVEEVELSVYNLLGQKIRTLFKGRSVPGPNVFAWDGSDDAGRSVSTGVYFYQLLTPGAIVTNKMIMIR